LNECKTWPATFRTPIQPDKQQFRYVKVENGSFKDWFGPNDTHV